MSGRTKSLVILVLLIMAVIPLSGCSGSSSNAPTATPAPASSPAATNAPAATGTTASARDWYTIAETEAKKQSSDVCLSQITNNNYADDGSLLPVDGKLHKWLYTFTSASKGMEYLVAVVDGKVSKVTPVTPTFAKSPINAWSVDSTAATVSAIQQYKQVTGADPTGLGVQYTLTKMPESGGKQVDEWAIFFNKNGNVDSTNVKVDANTGSIIA
jgi:hypothetical protein